MDIEITDALAEAPKYGSSKQTRQRRKSKRKSKGGKPGNRSTFHGGRAEFLRSHLPVFVDLKGKSRKAQNKFWHAVFAEYWQKWPWEVPLDKEPDEGDWSSLDTSIPEVLELKGEVIKKTQNVSQYF